MKKSVKHHKDHDKISASKHEEQGFYSSPSREHLTHPVEILTIKSLQAACFFLLFTFRQKKVRDKQSLTMRKTADNDNMSLQYVLFYHEMLSSHTTTKQTCPSVSNYSSWPCAGWACQ